MNREELEQLSITDLVMYANLNFGLGVTKDYNQFDIINQIEQSQRKFKGNALMRVVDEGDDGPVGPGMMKIRVRPGKHDRIPRPVIVGHQFKIASVPVNRDVIMPARYLVCFEDAVQDVYFTDELTKEWVCQQEHAYSYSVLEMGPKVGSGRATAKPPATVRKPLPPVEVEAPPAEDPVLTAVLALGEQMAALSARQDELEKKAVKPKVTKKTRAKRQPKKEG
jgi:hypothetical protein